MSEVLFKCSFDVSKHFSQKNTKRIFKNRLVQDPKEQHHKNYLIQKLIIAKLKNKLDEPIKCDINLSITFVFPYSVYFTKKDQRSKKIPDLSNIIQGPEDALIKAKIIEDDTQVIGLDGCQRIAGDKYSILITITKANDYSYLD